MKNLITLILLFITTYSYAHNGYEYLVDIKNIENDQVRVVCTTPHLNQSTVTFHFPKVIPGTYAVEDYGKYIEGFKPIDANGKELPFVKKGLNSYEISNAMQLAKVIYLVNDAMDMVVKENKIFEPASTNIERNKNVFMNNAGFFGYLEKMEKLPVRVDVIKPKEFFGATSLETIQLKDELQSFKADDYHDLLDNPILFAEPDTAVFNVNNCKVTIAVHSVNGIKRAKEFYEGLKRDMEGVARFMPTLPVDHYTFIVYADDFTKYGEIIDGKRKPTVSEIKEMFTKFRKLGIGALEHGSSSTYYLADFGKIEKNKELVLQNQMTGAAIHEFMHIITPLGLHSQHIGDFNYAEPVMSKHLWMYEGITEYFAGLIKLQAGIITPQNYFSTMKSKISAGANFPFAKMSFTEMSANVLNKPYKDQYAQVYTRGAVLAMLLDIEIIRLTQGKKTLKSVMLDLNKKYGKYKSFDEATWFDEFTKEVHPDLRNWFAKNIDSRSDYNLTEGLKPVGLNYAEKIMLNAPLDPANPKNNAIKLKKPFFGLLKFTGSRTIKKVNSAEWAGLQKGDKVPVSSYSDAFKKDGSFVPEGTVVKYTIIRNGEEKELEVKARYGQQEFKNYLGFLEPMTEQQKQFWDIYIDKSTGKKP